MYYFSMFFGLPFFLSVALSVLTIGLLGIAIERIVFRPVYEGPPLVDALISLGLLIFLENLALHLWGSDTRNVKTTYTEVTLSFFSVLFTLQRLIAFVASLILIMALYFFLNSTRMGKAIVATSQNRIGASLVGIDLSRVYMLTFAISSGLAGAGAALLCPIFYVFPTMGDMPLIKAFVVVVLGGMGNVQGAVAGGFLIGVIESLGGAYISSDYKDAFPFMILIGVLLTRSQGIFGRSVK
jgi:branched-chain amino acid transport system permease protein